MAFYPIRIWFFLQVKCLDTAYFGSIAPLLLFKSPTLKQNQQKIDISIYSVMLTQLIRLNSAIYAKIYSMNEIL